MSKKKTKVKALSEALIRQRYNLTDIWIERLGPPERIEKDKQGNLSKYWTHDQLYWQLRDYPDKPTDNDSSYNRWLNRKPRNLAIYEAWLARRWRRCEVLTKEFLARLEQKGTDQL